MCCLEVLNVLHTKPALIDNSISISGHMTSCWQTHMNTEVLWALYVIFNSLFGVSPKRVFKPSWHNSTCPAPDTVSIWFVNIVISVEESSICPSGVCSKIKAALKAEGILTAGLYQLDFYWKLFKILCLWCTCDAKQMLKLHEQWQEG